jgi:DNA-binding transcriptional MerR regulator
VNIQTIRYYERRGLVVAPRRTASGYRQYAEDAVSHLRFIKHAQDDCPILEALEDRGDADH